MAGEGGGGGGHGSTGPATLSSYFEKYITSCMVARSGTLAYIPRSIGAQLTRWAGGSREEFRAKPIATRSSQKRRCAA